MPRASREADLFVGEQQTRSSRFIVSKMNLAAGLASPPTVHDRPAIQRILFRKPNFFPFFFSSRSPRATHQLSRSSTVSPRSFSRNRVRNVERNRSHR